MIRKVSLTFFLIRACLAGPPLLVIALDGLRHDFPIRERAANLLALQSEGVSIEHLIPAFPSTTFPNFHSMATGLLPSHHGIVAMSFYDRARSNSFYYSRDASDGSWYGGKPIWRLAEEKGIRTATFFWPGSDAGIGGCRPTYWKKYDPKISRQEKSHQVLEWFMMPEPSRPGLVIVYFADVDSAGHNFGPDSAEIKSAIANVDQTVGELVRAVRSIRSDVNIVVLSDHGVARVERRLDLTSRADFHGCRAANEAPMTMLYCDDPQRVRSQLRKSAPEVHVWRQDELPRRLEYRGNPRIGDLIVVPKRPDIVYIVPPGDPEAKPVPALKGMHGYDPILFPAMHGIWIGVGPAFRTDAHAKQARTVDVMPVLCRLLGIEPPKGIDGRLDPFKGLLKAP